MYRLFKQISGFIFSLILVCFFIIFLFKVICCKASDNKARVFESIKEFTYSLMTSFHNLLHHLFHHQSEKNMAIREDKSD
jgi:hypothetical protein